MNLIIDQGNTRAKIAVFEGAQIVCEEVVTDLTFEMIRLYCQRYDIPQAILSSVKKLSVDLLAQLRSCFERFIVLDAGTPIPIENGYETPATLGCDRIAAMVGASEQNSGAAVIVIDAGTAITYDLMDEKGVFLGGNIAPGMALRFRALHEYTGKLPLVESSQEVLGVGVSTQTAIRSGVVQGICYEMNGFIADMKATHPSVLVFLTGGDANFFAEKLKYPIFVDNKLVLKGLNRILNYNVEK